MLVAENIQKTYTQFENKLHVLKGVDLKIEKGSVVSVVGPSGAGKSTLLHILGGLDRPTVGTVNFDGEDLYQLKDEQRAAIRNEKLGFIFQFYHLLPEFSALENVLLPALIKGDSYNDEQLELKAAGLLEQVGLKNRQAHKPNQLSGGEQQRVAIARALINEPRVIFCDEPTGNLDSESGRQIIDLLMELNEKNKQTLVMVTHDESIAKKAHTMFSMRDGQLT